MKLAAIITTYCKHSHAQHICDRFLEGYGWQGRHHRPELDLVSMYVDQVKDNDLSDVRAQRFRDLTIYPSIAEALTLGGGHLAVDGVLLIAEHGDYKRNEKGQILYPRYEFFTAMIELFKRSGSTVPVFNDKHLSWNWDYCREMYDTAVAMGFAFMAGSSLPVTRRLPPVEIPYGARVEEGLCLGYGSVDSYDFHGLEAIQCMVERRKGGESGVVWMDTYRGDRFWEAHEKQVWSADLFEAALSRSDNLQLDQPGFNWVWPTLSELKANVRDPIAYHYQHTDGLKCTLILLNGLLWDFNVAVRVAGETEPVSTQIHLPMPQQSSNQATFFSPLCRAIEDIFLSGRPTIPVERTLLTSGLTCAAVDSLFAGQKRVETPHLAISYAAPEASLFWNS